MSSNLPFIDSEDPPYLIAHLGGDPEMLTAHVPHAREIGMSLVQLRRDACTAKIPYAAKLVGDPSTGVVHGGVITTLLDNASGISVMCALKEFRSMATLDLRIDYMQPATPGKDIYSFCHCFKVTRSIAFVRGIAYHDNLDDPIATSTASFMLGTQGGSIDQTAQAGRS